MKIGKFDLERDGVFVIAEMSANHNGNLETALATIKAAKESGADAIKLQTYTADTITLNSKADDFMIEGGTLWDGRSLYELYEEAYTPWEWHRELFEYARSISIDIFSSPFDKSAVDFLEQFNPSAYKIASFEITDYELIRYTASKMRPMIISTGVAYEEELKEVVAICREVGNSEIVLLKCTSAYPAPLDEANLLSIASLAQEFDVVSGFSDHTIGATAPIVATALGAKVIEKHFILDKSVGGADAEFSMNAEEFKEMVTKIRESEQLLGNSSFEMDEKRKNNRRFCRSLYVSQDIKKGERITNSNIKSVRPGYGLHPKHLSEVLGNIAKRDYSFGDRFEL